MQRSSLGSSVVAHKGVAELNRVQRSSLGRNTAQEGAAELSMVQNISLECNKAE